MSGRARGELLRKVALRSATALVVANIVGSGIFTTTGFQAADLGRASYIYLLWIVGGVIAFCGALCYAELGAAMPRAGGEYVYLRETYGPALAFMSAFVSLVAGFSAPVAAALKSLVRYSTHFIPALHPDAVLIAGLHRGDAVAIGLVWLLVALHLRGVRAGFAFSDVVTVLKVGGIVVFIGAAFLVGKGSFSGMVGASSSLAETSPTGTLPTALATSLVFVMFCYSGWNAAAYIAGEMKQPQRDLPRSLLIGTLIVVVLYLGLNATYLYAVGVDGLAGQLEVGLIAARSLFGGWGVTLVAILICVSLTASASAMTIVGPRVYYAFGRDSRALRALGTVVPGTGAPSRALVLQGFVTSLLIVSGRVDQIQQYAGLTLTLFASLSVSCLLVLRFRSPAMERPFRAWGYPWTPLLFLGVSLWMMLWAFRGRPAESLLSLLTVAVGGALFLLLRRSSRSGDGRDGELSSEEEGL